MEFVVTTLGQLIDQVTPKEPSSETGRLRSGFVYHGSADATWSLLTSLTRLGGLTPPHTKAHLEAHILRHFLRYARPYLMSRRMDDWELLATAQHYGVPTRLLDWTYSPLIAAHFATSGQRGENGAAVWQLDGGKFTALSTSRSWRCSSPIWNGYSAMRGRFPPWQLFQHSDDKPFACLLEPPAFDSRLVAQSGIYHLSGYQSLVRCFIAQHGLSGALTKYIISPADVGRVRDQLELVGIDERGLFPIWADSRRSCGVITARPDLGRGFEKMVALCAAQRSADRFNRLHDDPVRKTSRKRYICKLAIVAVVGRMTFLPPVCAPPALYSRSS